MNLIEPKRRILEVLIATPDFSVCPIGSSAHVKTVISLILNSGHLHVN
jgi:hypothetical protein